MELLSLSEWKIDHALAGDEQHRRDQQLLLKQISEQNRDLREAHMKSLDEMEELKRFQELRVDEFSRRRLIENQDTINELAGRNHWISKVTEDTSPHVTSERQTQDTVLDPRCQFGPSARNSFDLGEGRFCKGLWRRPTKTADFGSSL